MSREEDVDWKLRLKGVPGILRGEEIADNPMFGIFELDGRHLCPKVSEHEVSFNFANGPEMNAVAMYHEQTVVVFRGMLEAIFKISARLVTRGAFPQIGNLSEQSSALNYGMTLGTPGETLASLELFNSDVSRFPWLLSNERLALFMFISNTMFRFVVFHELGHFFHEHGGQKRPDQIMDFDEMAGTPRLGCIDQQAKELLADTYAFQRLMHFQREHLMTPFPDPVRELLASHFAKSEEDLAIFVGTIVYIYFQMSDAPDDRERDPATWSHPPAPFRFKTILAIMLEYGVLDIPANAVARIITTVITRSQALITTMLDLHAPDEWLDSMNAPNFDEHYERLIETIPHWCTKDNNRWESNFSEAGN